MKKYLNGKTFLFVAFLAIAAAVVYANYAAKQANEGVEITDNIKGDPNATVVLTEYSDFQCPACAQFHPVVKDLVAEHDDLALEYKHFPLISIHPFAVPAAKAAEAAGQQGKFWEMHDKLFENQQVWSRSSNPRAFFSQYAEEIGLDMDQFNRQYGASLIEEHVEGQYDEARELGLTGTPSFLLNGERLEFETFDDFVGAVEAELGVVEGAATSSESASPSGTPDANVSDVQFGF